MGGDTGDAPARTDLPAWARTTDEVIPDLRAYYDWLLTEAERVRRMLQADRRYRRG